MGQERALPPAGKLGPTVLKALEAHGGVASNEQIETFAASELDLGLHGAAKLHAESGRTELGYRLAWARTKLRREGKIESRSKGIWALSR